MKAITLEDLKEEINNNLWRVTEIFNRSVSYGLNSYIRFGIELFKIEVVFGNKCNTLIYFKESELIDCMILEYAHGKVVSIRFNNLVIEKQEMNKEVFELLQSQDIPF